MSSHIADRHQPAFVYRHGAEKERRFAAAGGGAQPAFVYRHGAEKERRFAGAGGEEADRSA
jgi:hypothetical protein